MSVSSMFKAGSSRSTTLTRPTPAMAFSPLQACSPNCSGPYRRFTTAAFIPIVLIAGRTTHTKSCADRISAGKGGPARTCPGARSESMCHTNGMLILPAGGQLKQILAHGCLLDDVFIHLLPDWLEVHLLWETN